MVEAQTGYRLLDHTADAGLVAWGPNAASAFAEATRGMFAIMLGEDPSDAGREDAAEEMQVETEGGDWFDLLVNWLAELVFLFDTEQFVPTEVSFSRCEPPRCAGRLRGFRLDESEGAEGVLIKAVTYHQLEVEVTPERAELQVIFDI